MVRPDLIKWNQTLNDLLHLATESAHPRSRERFLALYMIASGQHNATQWAAQIGRENESVMNWVHRYNQGGPEALLYRHTGGNAPFLPRAKSKKSPPFSTPIRQRKG